jgi:arginase
MTTSYLLFSQWQGAGDLPGLAAGAERAVALAPPVAEGWRRVPVEAGGGGGSAAGVWGRDVLLRQLDAALALLRAQPADRIVTVGGDCSVELAPITTLNAAAPEDPPAVVWLDAHPDMSTPESSPSGQFQGMPLAVALGAGDPAFRDRLPSLLAPRQVALAGVRSVDEGERRLIEERALRTFAVKELRANPSALGDWLGAEGFGRVYVHVDLDVLDPRHFSSVGWPVPDGLLPAEVLAVVTDLLARFDCVGCGIAEYLPQAGVPADEQVLAGLLAALVPLRP